MEGEGLGEGLNQRIYTGITMTPVCPNTNPGHFWLNMHAYPLPPYMYVHVLLMPYMCTCKYGMTIRRTLSSEDSVGHLLENTSTTEYY